MALLVLCDADHRNTVWCDTKLRGITDEVNRRRDKVRVFTDFTAFENAAANLGSDSSVIILFDSISYIQSIAPALAKMALHPILAGVASEMRLPCRFSSVSADADKAARTIADYLHAAGKHRFATVGINPNSWSDVNRTEALRRYVPDSEHKIFYVSGDTLDSFRDFLAERDSFEAVFCITDLVAIALIEFLKENNAYGPSLYVISYGNTLMASLYGDGITTVSANYYECGKTAAELHYNRLKYGWTGAKILLDNHMTVRGSTENRPYIPSGNLPEALDMFPPTKEPPAFQIPTRPLGRMERMLVTADLADLRMIYCMLCGYDYEKTGEFCFLSAEAVRYRMRRLRNAVGVKNRAELISLFACYIQKENLLRVITAKEDPDRNRLY